MPQGVKINSKTYIDFLLKFFMSWYKKQPLAFKCKAKLLQDGDSAHTGHLTKDFLDKMGIKGAHLMTWPSNSLDLKPIKNLWAIVKCHVYANGRQFKFKS